MLRLSNFPGGRGIGDTVGRTLEHKEFMNDPHRAAREVWEQWG